MKAKIRDYYDIYVLKKEKYDLDKMYHTSAAATNYLPKALFQRAIVFVNVMEDENIQQLKPGCNISLNEIAEHFRKSIKIWN